jgi:hypothetical protein
MRELAEYLPELRFAADWKSLAWFVVRYDGDDHGRGCGTGNGRRRVKELVPVGSVAWRLEMDEVEERALDRTFSWNGCFSSRQPLGTQANGIKPCGTI